MVGRSYKQNAITTVWHIPTASAATVWINTFHRERLAAKSAVFGGFRKISNMAYVRAFFDKLIPKRIIYYLIVFVPWVLIWMYVMPMPLMQIPQRLHSVHGELNRSRRLKNHNIWQYYDTKIRNGIGNAPLNKFDFVAHAKDVRNLLVRVKCHYRY